MKSLLLILVSLASCTSVESQAHATLSLNAGIQATSELKATISMEEAERMMAHTTIMSYSTLHKKHQFFALD